MRHTVPGRRPHRPCLAVWKKASGARFWFTCFAAHQDREMEDNKNMENTKIPELFQVVSVVVSGPNFGHHLCLFHSFLRVRGHVICLLHEVSSLVDFFTANI